MNRLLIITILGIISFSGYTEELQKIQYYNIQQLSFNMDGIVKEVNVKEGDIVKKNQLLASLDQTILKLNIKKIQASLKVIDVELKEASDDFDRASELFERGVLTEVEMLKSERKLTAKKADKIKVTSELLINKHLLQEASLFSKIDGVVISNNLYPGKLVRNNLNLTAYIKIVPSDKVRFLIKSDKRLEEVFIDGKTYKVKYNYTDYSSNGAIDSYTIHNKNAFKLSSKRVKLTQ